MSVKLKMVVVSRFVWITPNLLPVIANLDTLWQAMAETAVVSLSASYSL